MTVSVRRHGDVNPDICDGPRTAAILGRDREVHLTLSEFRLLAVLIRNTGKVVTHRQLLKDVRAIC